MSFDKEELHMALASGGGESLQQFMEQRLITALGTSLSIMLFANYLMQQDDPEKALYECMAVVRGEVEAKLREEVDEIRESADDLRKSPDSADRYLAMAIPPAEEMESRSQDACNTVFGDLISNLRRAMKHFE
jgi:hypothetical protein